MTPSPSSSKGMLLNAMQNKMLSMFNKSGKSNNISIDEMEDEMTNKLIERGESGAKIWLVKERGFDIDMVNKGLVWNKSEKGKGGSVTMRGGLKDIMDYEFYGVQKGVWPNVQRLSKWVEFRVIRRDPSLRREYSEIKTQRGRDSMVERLTYLFGKAIHDNGLQRYATVDPTAYNAKITSREREQFYNKYDERHEPIVVYYKSGRAQKSKKIIPKRRYDSEFTNIKMSNKEWAEMEL